jgi:hypothetical protein
MSLFIDVPIQDTLLTNIVHFMSLSRTRYLRILSISCPYPGHVTYEYCPFHVPIQDTLLTNIVHFKDVDFTGPSHGFVCCVHDVLTTEGKSTCPHGCRGV